MPVVSPVESSSKVRCVVERQVVDVDPDAAVLRDERRTASARIVRLMSPRKSNFEEAERLAGVHLELGHGRAAVRGPLERHDLGQRLAADDDPGGVGRGVPRDPLELLGDGDQLVDPIVAGDQLAQLRRGLDRPLEADVQLVGDRLGDPVRLRVGEAHRPPHVADGGLGAQRPEGDDLRHPVVAVLAGDVCDHLVAARSPGSRCRCPASSRGRG